LGLNLKNSTSALRIALLVHSIKFENKFQPNTSIFGARIATNYKL